MKWIHDLIYTTGAVAWLMICIVLLLMAWIWVEDKIRGEDY